MGTVSDPPVECELERPPPDEAYFSCARRRVAPYLRLATARREIVRFVMVRSAMRRPVWLRVIYIASVNATKGKCE